MGKRKGKKKKRGNRFTLLIMVLDLLTSIIGLATLLIDKLTE